MHVSELDLKFTIQTKHFFKKVKQHTARPTNERLQPTNRPVHITNRNHEHSSIKQKKKKIKTNDAQRVRAAASLATLRTTVVPQLQPLVSQAANSVAAARFLITSVKARFSDNGRRPSVGAFRPTF